MYFEVSRDEWLSAVDSLLILTLEAKSLDLSPLCWLIDRAKNIFFDNMSLLFITHFVRREHSSFLLPTPHSI